MKIIMDTREDRNTENYILLSAKGHEVEIKQMGPDYLVPDLGWAIERKCRDFYPTAMDKMKSQVQELLDGDHKRVFLAIDHPQPKRLLSLLGPVAYFGMMARFDEMGATVVLTSGHLSTWLDRMILKHTQPSSPYSPIRKRVWQKRAYSKAETRAHILAQLPGVGLITAQKYSNLSLQKAIEAIIKDKKVDL